MNYLIEKTKITTCLIWAFIGLALPVQGQSTFAKDNYQFELFELPGGKLANNVQCMAQDSKGFLWFGSQNGLIKYDGSRFFTYYHEPNDSNSLASNYVECIHIDKNDVLWVGSYDAGLTRFDPINYAFKRYKASPSNPNGMQEKTINTIIEDADGDLWIGTHNGIVRYDPEKDKFRRYFSIPKEELEKENNYILVGEKAKDKVRKIFRSLYIDRQNTLWAGEGFTWENNLEMGGLYKYKEDQDTFEVYKHDDLDKNSLSDNRVKAIFEDSRNQFWIGTMGDGVNIMDRQTNEFKSFPYSPTNKDGLSRPKIISNHYQTSHYDQVQFFHEDQANRIWFAALWNGLSIYDPKEDRQINFQDLPNETHGLSTNYIWNFFETRDHTKFILTGGNGGGKTFKVKVNPQLFPFVSLGDHKLIRQITEDQQGTIWVGTSTKQNLDAFNRDQQTVEKYSLAHPPLTAKEEVLPEIFSLAIFRDGKLRAGFAPGSVQLFDPQTKNSELIVFQDSIKRVNSLANQAIYEDRLGNIWIGSWGYGLYKFDKKTQSFSLFTSKEGSLGGSHISTIFEDKSGKLWVGGGKEIRNDFYPFFLDRFDVATNKFEQFVEKGSIYGYPPNLVEDEVGDIWFATTLDGIRKLEVATKNMTHLNKANSNLPSEQIRSMIKDQTGQIWMTTEKELVKFDPTEQTFLTYNQEDGISIPAFQYSAAYASRDGYLYFGGEGGFHYFHPDDIDSRLSKQKPLVSISALEVNGTEINHGPSSILVEPIWDTQELTLAHYQNSLAFGLTCIDYQAPEEVLIEYRLDNHDPDWQKAYANKQAIYNNLQPGTYTFQVRGTNSIGVANKEGARIEVTIRPPWWKTWWAYASYLLLFGSAVYALYRFQLKRQEERQEAIKLREFNELKTKLYANITHEFRTPLTLILGLVNQIKPRDLPPGIPKRIANIEKNGQQLLRLVNQLLDLRKLESRQETLHLAQGNIVPPLRYITDSFESLAESRGIDYEIILPKEAVIMDYDFDKLQKVLANLLSNALKFTEREGKVTIKVKQNSGQLLINVKDTGVGIAKEKLPYVFDRFFQSEDRKDITGTGIGLSLAKELVELMQGTIKVESIQGVGTDFQVQLPIQNQAALLDQFEASVPMSIPSMPQPSTTLESLVGDEELPIVLLVEDNQDVAEFTASCLKNKYTIHFAKDGQEGIDKALELIPDLIISDVMMPNKNGYELCDFLKKDEKTSHIPIILLTAKIDIEDKVTGLERGADAYLAKPFHEAELKIRIKRLIELRQNLRARYAGLNLKEPTKDKSLQIEDAFILKVRDIVNEHLDDETFGVEELSKAIFLSRAQVHRKIKALTGKPTGQFIHTIRLHEALKLVQKTDKSITEIAFDVGYSDPSYFSRMFTREFGHPPSYYANA